MRHLTYLSLILIPYYIQTLFIFVTLTLDRFIVMLIVKPQVFDSYLDNNVSW